MKVESPGMSLEEAVSYYDGRGFTHEAAFVIRGMPDIVGLSRGPSGEVVMLYKQQPESVWRVAGASGPGELFQDTVFAVSDVGATVVEYSHK